MEFGIGIIGATGFIGTPYRKEIRDAPDDVRIVALCARRRDRLEAAAKDDSAELITHNWRDVVEHPDVNLVLVLTPDALHYEPVIACAELGKHVFCEKPVGKDVTQAYAMWKAVQSKGLLHYVPFWTRYVPVFQRAHQLVSAGKLGSIRGIVYRWHNPRPLAMPFTWRDDAQQSAAGSIADVGSHAYDTLRFILGIEAKRVLTHAETIMSLKPDLGAVDLSEAIAWGNAHSTTDSEQRRKATAPDYAQISIEFTSGIVGYIVLSHASYFRKGFAPELELHGTDGSLSVDRITGELKLADSPEPARTLENVTDDGHCNRFARHVFPALRERAAGLDITHPGLDDGWRTQIFTDAAIASARRGTWVELSEFDEEVA